MSRDMCSQVRKIRYRRFHTWASTSSVHTGFTENCCQIRQHDGHESAQNGKCWPLAPPSTLDSLVSPRVDELHDLVAPLAKLRTDESAVPPARNTSCRLVHLSIYVGFLREVCSCLREYSSRERSRGTQRHAKAESGARHTNKQFISYENGSQGILAQLHESLTAPPFSTSKTSLPHIITYRM